MGRLVNEVVIVANENRHSRDLEGKATSGRRGAELLLLYATLTVGLMHDPKMILRDSRVYSQKNGAVWMRKVQRGQMLA